MLLQRVAIGDSVASEELLPIVYEDLRAMAGSHFRAQRADHTLQPTALVHEAYLRLAQASDDAPKNRSHFMAVAAIAMRQILHDHARAKAATKRKQGGAQVDFNIDQVASPSGDQIIDIIALDEALSRLGKLDETLANVVELWFFGGMSSEEIAQIQGVSIRTVQRQCRHARAWLNSELYPV